MSELAQRAGAIGIIGESGLIETRKVPALPGRIFEHCP
jgi:hypothetical protein